VGSTSSGASDRARNLALHQSYVDTAREVPSGRDAEPRRAGEGRVTTQRIAIDGDLVVADVSGEAHQTRSSSTVSPETAAPGTKSRVRSLSRNGSLS
jgi:hypothetical protein